MAKATSKITLSASRDIPFNKLVLSQANVRRTKAGQTIENLAVDIGRRGLLQSLNVRPMLDADGTETDMFEIPAGGRRYRALELLVKQKRMSKTQLVPCIVVAADSDMSAEEDSLAENVHREELHPLDQFRAFLDLRTKGIGDEEIAADDSRPGCPWEPGIGCDHRWDFHFRQAAGAGEAGNPAGQSPRCEGRSDGPVRRRSQVCCRWANVV